jgi:hypothetical protein
LPFPLRDGPEADDLYIRPEATFPAPSSVKTTAGFLSVSGACAVKLNDINTIIRDKRYKIFFMIVIF